MNLSPGAAESPKMPRSLLRTVHHEHYVPRSLLGWGFWLGLSVCHGNMTCNEARFGSLL